MSVTVIQTSPDTDLTTAVLDDWALIGKGATVTTNSQSVGGLLASQILLPGLDSGYRSGSLYDVAQKPSQSIKLRFDFGRERKQGAVCVYGANYLPVRWLNFDGPSESGSVIADTGWVHPEYESSFGDFGWLTHPWFTGLLEEQRTQRLIQRRWWNIIYFPEVSSRFAELWINASDFADPNNIQDLGYIHSQALQSSEGVPGDVVDIRGVIVGRQWSNPNLNIDVGGKDAFDDRSQVVIPYGGGLLGRRGPILRESDLSLRSKEAVDGSGGSWEDLYDFVADEINGGRLGRLAIHRQPAGRRQTARNFGLWSASYSHQTARPNGRLRDINLDLLERR